MERPLQLPDETWQTKETKNLRQTLTARLDKLQKDRSELARRRQQVADATGVDAANAIYDGQELHFQEVALLTNELQLREDAQAFFESRRSDMAAELEAAIQADQEARVDVRKRLVSIGYVDQRVGNRPCIEPGMIMRHPKVYAALQRLRTAQAARDDLTAENRQAILDLQQRIDKIKKAALALPRA